jgi:hypothetical protein
LCKYRAKKKRKGRKGKKKKERRDAEEMPPSIFKEVLEVIPK